MMAPELSDAGAAVFSKRGAVTTKAAQISAEHVTAALNSVNVCDKSAVTKAAPENPPTLKNA